MCSDKHSCELNDNLNSKKISNCDDSKKGDEIVKNDNGDYFAKLGYIFSLVAFLIIPFTCGLSSYICIVGLVFSIFGLKSANVKKKAVIGLILSILGMLFLPLAAFIYLAFLGNILM